MFTTGCYVCNFNGKEYAKKCIQSVLEQTQVGEDFHLFLVDNASTDGSVECIRKEYGRKVTIIENTVNLGGAGGFNRALKDAVEKNYTYVILLDNDVTLAPDCILKMTKYMEAHADVGCIGAKIMMMDHPEYMQEFGVHLDFEHYNLIHDYWFELDQGTEDVIESDCVASCALMARVSCLNKTNLFPEENFLYWDDLEFTYQIKLTGYRVISLASAVAYHKGKKKPCNNTAPGYYGMRNRLKFFSKYESKDRLPHLCRNTLEDCFQYFFGSALKGFHSSNSSRMFALDDFVHKQYGIIAPDKLYSMDEKADRVNAIVKNQKMVYVELSGEMNDQLLEAVGVLFRRLDEMDHIEKTILLISSEQQREEISVQLKRYYENDIEFAIRPDEKGVIFRPCSHVKDITEDIRPVVWFDKYLNCVENQEDYGYIKAYPYLKEFFINTHYEWLMKGIVAERKRE